MFYKYESLFNTIYQTNLFQCFTWFAISNTIYVLIMCNHKSMKVLECSGFINSFGYTELTCW